MKRLTAFILAAACLGAVLTGCGRKPAPQERPWPDTIVMSNLNDKESRELLERLLTALPADEDQREMFFRHVDQFNGCLEPGELTGGFEEVGITASKYDPYEIQDRWAADHPDFPGYNCRITAFSLFRSLLNTQEDTTAGSPDYIMMDLQALDADPSAVPDEKELDRFRALYTGIETENTKDIQVHLKNLQQDWKDRHISFEKGGARLISVVFHDQIDGDMLFIGHTGLLFDCEDGLYFLEKLAFQEPYQLVKIENRAQLSDYLMTKYDIQFGQPTASPFILENDRLMEGYRQRPEP